MSDHTGTEFKFWKVKASDGPDELRPSLLQMREIGITEFLLLASIAKTKMVLSMARRLGIVARPYAWLLLHLVRKFTRSLLYFNMLNVFNNENMKGGWIRTNNSWYEPKILVQVKSNGMYGTISAIFTIPSPKISSIVCVDSTRSHEHLPRSEVRLEIMLYCELNPERKYFKQPEKNCAETVHERGKGKKVKRMKSQINFTFSDNGGWIVLKKKV